MNPLSNYWQSIILLVVGLTVMIAAAFLLVRAKDQAAELSTMGHAICGAALMMLYQSRGAEPAPRVFLGGERATDKPAPKEGSASG